jgi:transcriptional regulator with XRE-family HTH domain
MGRDLGRRKHGRSFDPKVARLLRERLGVTLRELAEVIGLEGLSSLSQRERGRYRIDGPCLLFYESLEVALAKYRPARVWGPLTLTPHERLARIHFLAFGDDSLRRLAS